MSHTDNPPAAVAAVPNRAAVIAEVRDLFLDRVEKVIRMAGVDSPVSIAALRAGAVQLLDQMTTEGARTGFALANSLTASQIRLVDDNQLELSIRLGDISKHLRDECADGLYKFHLRFVTLLDRPSLRVADDPLSPEAICRALAEMFGSTDTAHLSTLARLADIETHLASELPLMYAELAELLVRRQIAPAKLQTSATETRAGSHRRGGDGAGGSGDAMAALQQVVLARLMPAGGLSAGGLSAGGMVAGGMVAAGDTAPRFEQIMGQLDQWQAQAQSDLFGGSAEQVAENALTALKTSEAMSRLRAQDTVALDVLSALFDALFDDPRLSSAVKAAVARLQIPVLKAAIIGGATFFTDADHPARALLAAMGQATIGLEPNVDATHPVCAEIQRIAAGVQGEFQRDTEVFARYGAELESFMARRHHDLQGSAQGYIALAKVQEEHDVALRAAWRLVASRTLAAAPLAVADFLREHWTKVLAADWLYGGQRGEQWQNDERVLDDLLWSIQPKSEAEDRRRLGQLVPDLLGRIKAGLDRVGVQGEARAPFLEACFALQAAAIRGRSTQTAAPTGPAADSVDGDTLVVLMANGNTLKSLRSANPDARASGDAVRELVIGDWVEFVMPDGNLRCGRLCWVSAELGNPLFMNSAWDCAISVARSSLERQFAAGQASTGSTLSFFDNAIEKALHKSIPARP
jgi:hypothetical protein